MLFLLCRGSCPACALAAVRNMISKILLYFFRFDSLQTGNNVLKYFNIYRMESICAASDRHGCGVLSAAAPPGKDGFAGAGIFGWSMRGRARSGQIEAGRT